MGWDVGLGVLKISALPELQPVLIYFHAPRLSSSGTLDAYRREKDGWMDGCIKGCGCVSQEEAEL